MQLSKLNIFENNWVDLVFQGRNHNYGAYVLRKKSDEYTNKGLLFAIIFFTLAVASPVIIKYIEGVLPKSEVKMIEVNKLDAPPPLDKNTPPPPPPPTPPPLKSTVKFTPPEIKPDEQIQDEEPPPTQQEMEKVDASANTEVGDPNGVDKSLLGDGDNVTGEDKNEILMFAEQMPEFDGGEAAMNAFIINKYNYPPLARENQIEKKVIVQFVVDKDGKITQVEALTHHGWGLEEEAIRVVKLMPAWKPGKQNGKPVTVRCTLTISLKLN